jgi:hypothetical protein
MPRSVHLLPHRFQKDAPSRHTSSSSLLYNLLSFSLAFSLGLAFFAFSPPFVFAQNAKQAPKNPYKEAMQEAIAAYQAEKYDDALQALEKAMKSKKGRPLLEKAEIFTYIGLVLFKQNKKGMAFKSFEMALYQDICLQLPPKETPEAKAFFEETRSRVSRRGGIVGADPGCVKSTPSGSDATTPQPPPSGAAPISPWPWVAVGAGALFTVAGVLFMINGFQHNDHVNLWRASTSGKGYNQADLDLGVQPIQDTAGWQIPTGIAFLALGLLGISVSIPLFMYLPARSPAQRTASAPQKRRDAQTASRFSPPPIPSQAPLYATE